MTRQKLIQSLLDWHKKSNIEHSWKSHQAYPAWVAETVLQQTRIAQGTSYIHRFLARFPDVQVLAKAPIDNVLQVWEGLGYYRRAHLMHKAAKIVHEQGYWPSTKEGWGKLPGIGPYTAGALASFVNGENCSAIDGNVIRVFARWYDIEMDLLTSAGHKHLEQLIGKHLEICHAKIYNQVLMDFGSHTCKPKSPDCSRCVAQEYCQSYRNKTVGKRPLKKTQRKKKSRYFILYWHKDKNQRIETVKREKKDIWQGLWTLPFQEITSNEWNRLVSENNLLKHRQILSHQCIHTALVFKSHAGLCPLPVKTMIAQEAIELPMDRSSRHFFDLLTKESN
tara:strand:+ start:1852 stop:2859 length:1008 start_codon:yes stop_codon:yes gene_type:complete